MGAGRRFFHPPSLVRAARVPLSTKGTRGSPREGNGPAGAADADGGTQEMGGWKTTEPGLDG